MDGKQLKNSILQWAIQGKLVPQNPKDEPASKLLERIAESRNESSLSLPKGTAKGTKSKDLKKKTSKNQPSCIYCENGVWYEQVGAAAPKDISDEIPFEIPENWAWCRFGNLVFNRDSERIPLSVDERKGLKKIYDYYGASGVIDKVDNYLFDKPLLLIGEDGANLINRSTPIAFIARGQYWVNNHAHVIDCINEDLLQYVCTFINAISLVDYVTGTAQPKMNQEKMNSILVAVPPLAEQKRIVAKLEQVLPLAEEYGAAQEQLDKLNKELPEALKKSILQEAIQGKLVPQNPKDEPASVLLAKIRKEKEALVKQGKLKKKDLESTQINEEEIPFELPMGWVWARFEDLSLDSADGPFGSNLKKEHYTDKKEVRIIQLSNIGEDGWRDLNTKYTSFEHLKNISRSEAFPGDIIVAKMMPAGRAIICPDMDKKYVLSSDAVRFDFSNLLYKKYLYWAINSTVVKDQVYSEVQGITRVRTSLSKLRTYLIPIPPLAEQKRIVAKLEQLFKVL